MPILLVASIVAYFKWCANVMPTFVLVVLLRMYQSRAHVVMLTVYGLFLAKNVTILFASMTMQENDFAQSS